MCMMLKRLSLEQPQDMSKYSAILNDVHSNDVHKATNKNPKSESFIIIILPVQLFVIQKALSGLLVLLTFMSFVSFMSFMSFSFISQSQYVQSITKSKLKEECIVVFLLHAHVIQIFLDLGWAYIPETHCELNISQVKYALNTPNLWNMVAQPSLPKTCLEHFHQPTVRQNNVTQSLLYTEVLNML